MNVILYVAIGIVGGIIGGMGMGGGTLLIPLLTLICSIGQKSAQAINLVAFIPMSVIACVFHIKNKLIDYKFLWLSLPALISSVLASILASLTPWQWLKVGFGIFLLILGLIQLCSTIVNKQKNDENKKFLFYL